MLVITLFIGSIMVDFMLAARGEKPYFFDPARIESYDQSMLEESQDDLLQNYNQYTEAIKSVERELAFLPDNQKLSVEFLEHSEISLSVSYLGGYKSSYPFDYKAEENQEFMLKIGVSPEKLDNLKIKVKAANCISFEKEKGIRLGFEKKNDGTFYYRFKSHSPIDEATLLDSCLIRELNDEILIEYKGKGRGPDCMKSKNAIDFDDRSFLIKWKDLILKDRKIIFKKKPTY